MARDDRKKPFKPFKRDRRPTGGFSRPRERPDAAGNRTIRQRRPPEHLQTRGVDQRALCVEMERSRARVERARQTIDAAGDCKEPLTRQRDVSSITGLLQRTLSENLIDAAQPGADARSRVPPGQEYVFKVAALALEAGCIEVGEVVADHVQSLALRAQAGDTRLKSAKRQCVLGWSVRKLRAKTRGPPDPSATQRMQNTLSLLPSRSRK